MKQAGKMHFLLLFSIVGETSLMLRSTFDIFYSGKP